MTHASAPGKIILFGEHAVVYGRPALAVPVAQIHADVDVRDSRRRGVWIHAPDIGLHAELSSLPPDHAAGAAVRSVFAALGISSPPPLEIEIASTIPVASGLGSGAAVTVALIRALSSFLSHPLPNEQVNRMAYEVEKLHHGTPSGIDNTVVAYARPVHFVKGRPIETFRVASPFTLVIADTGVPAPTKESVADVRRLWESDKAKWEKVFDEIGKIVEKAREAIEKGKPLLNTGEGTNGLGDLMNQNHALLQQLTVSSPELDRLVETARRAGAGGAKLSGGGRGGNMIALAAKEEAGRVAEALRSAGAVRTIIAEVAP